MSQLIALRMNRHSSTTTVAVDLDSVFLIAPDDKGGSVLHLKSAPSSLIVEETVGDIMALSRVRHASRLYRFFDNFTRIADLEDYDETRVVATVEQDDASDRVEFNYDERDGGWHVGPPPAEDALPAPLLQNAYRKSAAEDDAISARERFLAATQEAIGTLSSRTAPGTSSGRLACAWAVNEIAVRALGHPLGGGLSTIRMAEALKANNEQVHLSALLPGDVIISPTKGKVIGHVGVLLDSGGTFSARIASNSSGQALFVQNFTLESWIQRYTESKKLAMLFFRVA